MASGSEMLVTVVKMMGVNVDSVIKILDQFKPKQLEPKKLESKIGEDVGAYWDGEYGQFFLTDRVGNKLTKETFANVSDFEEGLAVIERQKDKGSRCGFIDPAGKFPFEPIYDTVQIFTNGLAPVQLKKKWGFIDKTGKQVISLKCEVATRFDMNIQGQAQVREGDRWFYINREGGFVKSCEKPQG